MYLPAVSLGRMIFTTCGGNSGVSGASPRTPTLDEGGLPEAWG